MRRNYGDSLEIQVTGDKEPRVRAAAQPSASCPELQKDVKALGMLVQAIMIQDIGHIAACSP